MSMGTSPLQAQQPAALPGASFLPASECTKQTAAGTVGRASRERGVSNIQGRLDTELEGKGS